MARRIWLLPVLLAPVFIIATLPAALVVPRLDLPVAISQVRGSIWSGQADWQQPGWQPLTLRWRWAGGRDWRWQADDGQTALAGLWRPGPDTMLPHVQGRLELQRLDLVHWLQVARPVGVLELDLTDVVVRRGHGLQASGRVTWRRAGLTGAIQESLGDIEITVDANSAVDQGVLLTVRSLTPAVVQVRGTIGLDSERYQTDLWLRAAAGRGDLTSALAALGELQPDGQVRLRIGGRTGL
ncbi:MAG: type II secretion system protein N [Wenzhouxiangella sp.]